ncbi:MAG: YraN family protein [Candidatus Hydrogenedens sp.]|nr:YraN family protein [Candidatus Hydrogenedens sp.]
MLRFFKGRGKEWMLAEDLAARHLKKQGYRILHRNIRLDRFEMDIVAQKADTVVFAEVRSRSDDSHTAPENTVQHAKQQHLREAARRYLARFGEEDVYYRFDVIGILMAPGEKPQLTHIENAFGMDPE